MVFQPRVLDPRRPAERSTDERVLVLVARAHPIPTQTFHRRSAAALAGIGVRVVRVAMKRLGPSGGPHDATRFPREEGARAWRAFGRAPFRALAGLVGLWARARPGDKEGGRSGAVAAWADGLRLADWGRRQGDVGRFHAQFASWEATTAWTAARLLGVPFSFEVHNPYTWVRGRSALRAKARAADVVTAISEEARRRMLALDGALSSKVRVVRCGVPPSRPDASMEAGVSPYDVLAVGSLVPRKGHEVLVRAVALLARERPDVRAAIVGEGEERARLEALLRETGAPVTLLGARSEEETLALTRRARVAALACVVAPDGDEDGIPVALLEAMAAGVPVVSTAVGGIPELLEEGRAGLLVAPGDAVGFSAALSRLLRDERLAASLGEAGRGAVEARHALSDTAWDLARALGVPSSGAPPARRADRPADPVPGPRL